MAMRKWGVGVIVLASISLCALLFAHSGSSADISQTSVDGTGNYRLIASDGTLFSRSSLRGHPYVTYYGYASCPDRCPQMLGRLGRLKAAMGEGGRDLEIVFITVDPEHDTPERLATFVRALGVPIIALTGSSDAINRVTDNAGIYVSKVDLPNGRYRMEHTTKGFVYSRSGEFWDTISPEESDTAIIAKLRDAASGQSSPPSADAAQNGAGVTTVSQGSR